MATVARGRNLISATLANTVERHRLTEEQKLIVVNLIDERKHILFGKRSDIITPEARRAAWDDVIEECRQVYGFDAVGPGKDYRHLRNHVWSDMKQVVVKKIRDGQDNSFTRIEAAILEIIGQQDLPITVSIRSSQRPVLAPGEAHTEDQPAANQIEESMDQNDVSQEPRADESSNFPPARSERPIIIHRAASPEAEPDEPQRPTFYRRRLNRVRPELYDHASMIRTLGVRSDRRNKIVGLLPVVDSHSAKRARSSIALQSISFSPKRPCRDMMDSEEEEEEDNREQRRLKQLLLREQIEHYRLLNEKARLENEKLKLEVEAMRPPPS